MKSGRISDPKLTEGLKKFAKARGVDRIGVAPIERFAGAPLVPSSLPHKDPCLGKDCGQCLQACPAGALSLEGTDKKKCLAEGVHAQNLSGLLEHISKILAAESLEEKKKLLHSAESRVLYQFLAA